MLSMICREVMDEIERAYPGDYALGWDNVGLLAGRDNKEVKCIYIALDATDEVIEEAVREQADMLVTHHPLIFSGIKRINNQDFLGRRLLNLLRNDISYYAMHTNYDVCRMAGLAGEKMGLLRPEILEVTHEDKEPLGIGEIACLPWKMTLRECAESVKEAFHLGNVKVFGDLEKKINRAAICPGSGKSVIGTAVEKKADVLITGDIGHHDGIDAVAQGLAVIDAGHYGIEHIFMEDLRSFLGGTFKDIRIVTAPVIHPFQIV